MLDFYLCDLLNHILPHTGTSKHDTLRLEYISACKFMENEDCINTITHIPAILFGPLLQSVIYDCYSKFINTHDFSNLDNLNSLNEIDIPFPKTLGILILNWPYEELILRNHIPLLDPPVDIFKNQYPQLVSQKLAICKVEHMLTIFQIFCNLLIQFIMYAIFKGTHTTKHAIVCNLRRIDVSGFQCSYATEYLELRGYFSIPDEILKEIRNSTSDTYGHKIDIFADAELFTGNCQDFQLLSNIVEESLNPKFGVSISFKTINAMYCPDLIPYDIYSALALGGCEYIQLNAQTDDELHEHVNQEFAGNLNTCFPGLLGFQLIYLNINESLNFFSTFENLEQLSICLDGDIINDLTNGICNMRKGLKYLKLRGCELNKTDFECLSKSIHSDTLLQVDLSCNGNSDLEPTAEGLVTLCQNLKNVKVLILDSCSLDTLSSNSVSKLLNAFKSCDSLEFISMKNNNFFPDITNLIIDGLAHKKSLRYLCLNLSLDFRMRRSEIKKKLQNMCKTFHERINKFRNSPIYISWEPMF